MLYGFQGPMWESAVEDCGPELEDVESPVGGRGRVFPFPSTPCRADLDVTTS